MITENGRKTRNSGSETELAHSVVIIMTHPYILISAHRSMMAERISPPSAKKAKRTAPVYRVSAEERAKQFKGDLYADGGVLSIYIYPYWKCPHRSFKIKRAGIRISKVKDLLRLYKTVSYGISPDHIGT